jgi:hypothetical protein
MPIDIEAGHIEFVEVAAQEQRVLRVLESRETLDDSPPPVRSTTASELFATVATNRRFFFEIHAHVVETPFDFRQRNRLHRRSACFSWADASQAKQADRTIKHKPRSLTMNVLPSIYSSDASVV